MAQIMAGDIRKGVTFLYEGKIMTIVEFQHVKPGKGAAFVRTKMKNVVDGRTLENTFNPTDKLELAHIETKDMEYLYTDGEFYYFMDKETYEQIPLNHSQVEDALQFVKENGTVKMKFFQGSPFSVEPENFVELLITICEPAAIGNRIMMDVINKSFQFFLIIAFLLSGLPAKTALPPKRRCSAHRK